MATVITAALVPGCGKHDKTPPAPPPTTAAPADAAGGNPDAPPADPAATPLTIGPGVSATCPGCLHLTARDVVWRSGGTIATAAKAGGLSYRPAASDQLPVEEIALDADGIVWINRDTGDITTVPSDGSDAPPRVIATLGGDVRPGLAVDSDHVFANRDGALVAVPRKGGAPRLIANGTSGPYVVADGRVYFLAGGKLSAAPVKGGAARPVAAGLGAPPALVIDGGRAFWTDPSGGAVKSIALDGSEPAPRVLASAEPSPTGLAVADGFVYFTTAAAADRGGAIKRVARDGGAVEVVAAGEEKPVAVAVDASAIYWIAVGTEKGGLRKLSRPAP